ncbi:hypothetical protein K449DRAFT_320065, partial [Hypoxylon sp. EC38]
LYYYGLPSNPRLVARSSRKAWEGVPPGEPHPRPKTLQPVSDRSVVDKWDLKLQKQIINALGATKWTSINILRIGYGGDQENVSSWPVVLWIGVSNGSTDWTRGMGVVAECIDILEHHGLLNVECEIKESEIQNLQSGEPYPPPLPKDNAMIECHFPLTASPGQSIAAEKTPYVTGTLGLYLKSNSSRSQTQDRWGLTCRHVVFPDTTFNDEYRFEPNTDKPHNILMPADEAVSKMKSKALDQLDALNKTKSRAERTLKTKNNRKSKRAAQREKIREEMKGVETKIIQTQEFLQQVLPHWEATASRIMGHVVFAPPLQAANPINPNDLSGPTRDWALIELDKSKFGESLPNAVDIGLGVGMRDFKKLSRWLKTCTYNQPRFELPPDNNMVLNGVVSIAELREPKMKDANGTECLIVGKRGAKSGVTWGRGNQALSIIRSRDGLITYEWAVLYLFRDYFVPFSKAGDSGSVVFDIEGRVVGILTSGDGRTKNTDITYVTPMEWLLKDMKDNGY